MLMRQRNKSQYGNVRSGWHKAILPALAFLANPAFWAGAGNAVSAAGGAKGLFDSFFGKKGKGSGTVSLEPMKEGFQMDLGKRLSNIYQGSLGGYKPGQDYSRLSQLTNPSQYEQQGLDYLQEYISGNIKPEGLMGQASDVLKGTLAGDYDPFESKYYESLRRNIEDERQQNMKKLNQQLSKIGGGSSYRYGRVSDIGQQNFDKISDVLATLQEQERNNQLNAVTGAQNFTNTFQNQIRNKLSTIMDIGSLPRQLEGVGYQDFLRKQGEFSDVATRSQDLFKYNIPYGLKELDYTIPTADSSGGISSLLKGVGGLRDIFTSPTVGKTTAGLNTSMEGPGTKKLSDLTENEFWKMYYN